MLVSGNPMQAFHQKLKRLSITLSKWSKEQLGDINAMVKSFEERIKEDEEELITSNTDAARMYLHCLSAEYIMYLKLKESILK